MLISPVTQEQHLHTTTGLDRSLELVWAELLATKVCSSEQRLIDHMGIAWAGFVGWWVVWVVTFASSPTPPPPQQPRGEAALPMHTHMHWHASYACCAVRSYTREFTLNPSSGPPLRAGTASRFVLSLPLWRRRLPVAGGCACMHDSTPFLDSCTTRRHGVAHSAHRPTALEARSSCTLTRCVCPPTPTPLTGQQNMLLAVSHLDRHQVHAFGPVCTQAWGARLSTFIGLQQADHFPKTSFR